MLATKHLRPKPHLSCARFSLTLSFIIGFRLAFTSSVIKHVARINGLLGFGKVWPLSVKSEHREIIKQFSPVSGGGVITVTVDK